MQALSKILTFLSGYQHPPLSGCTKVIDRQKMTNWTKKRKTENNNNESDGQEVQSNAHKHNGMNEHQLTSSICKKVLNH